MKQLIAFLLLASTALLCSCSPSQQPPTTGAAGGTSLEQFATAEAASPPTQDRLNEIAASLRGFAAEIEVLPEPPPPPPPPPDEPPVVLPPSDDPMLDVVPDVSGDPEARIVSAGEVLEISGPLSVSTLHGKPGSLIKLIDGYDISIKDRPPTDAGQMTIGLIVEGKIEASGNGVIRSENPAGNRGHVIFLHRAEVDLVGVEFRDLGRTRVEPLNDTTNRIGRYAAHFHRCFGPVSTAKPYQFRISGCTITRPLKWGIAVHDSHWGEVTNNHVVGSGEATGAGIVQEEGNEVGNLIAGNRIENCLGTLVGERVGAGGGLSGPDFGFEGSGIWSKSLFSEIRDNQIDNCRSSGLVFFPPHVNEPLARLPNFRGANTRVDANVTLTNPRDTSRMVNVGNRVSGSRLGVEAWNLDGTDTWQLDGCTITGAEIGYASNFAQGKITVRNCVIDADYGIFPHRNAAAGEVGTPGAYAAPVIVHGSTFRGKVGLMIRPSLAHIKDCRIESLLGIKLHYHFQHPQRLVLVENTVFTQGVIESQEFTAANMNPNDVKLTLVPNEILLLKHNGDPRANYRLHLPEQAPSYVPFEEIGLIRTGPPGKTNAEMQALFGVSTWAYMTPPTAQPLAGTSLLAEPIPAVLPQQPVLTAPYLQRTYDEAAGEHHVFIESDIPCRPLLAVMDEYRKHDGSLGTRHEFIVKGPPGRQQLHVLVRSDEGRIAYLATNPE